MTRPFVALILVSLSKTAFAAEATPPPPTPATETEPGRGGTVSLAYDHNPGNLSSVSFGGDVGVSKTLGILANYKADELPANYAKRDVGSFGVGLDNEFTRAFTAGFGLEYATLPDSVSSKGFNLGGHLRFGQWRFGLLLRSLRYTSDRATVGKKLRDKGIPEQSAGADVAYRFAEDWKVRVGYTGYSYGNASPAELSDVLATRGNTAAGLISAVEGFPSASANVGLLYSPTDHIDLDLNFARTKYKLATDSTTATFSVNDQFTPSWGAGPSVAGLWQAGQPNGAIIGLQGSYTWE